MEEAIVKAPRDHLFEFVVNKHHGQVRKYTGEPYFNHVKAVAEMADGICNFGYEIGLCHDLLEDTDCKQIELYHAVCQFGYSAKDANFIIKAVIELTDVYTAFEYSEFNRKQRKKLEAERLSSISETSQTVKYCDFINNTESIVKHDPGFAKVYLAEKAEILAHMNKGNQELYKKAQDNQPPEPYICEQCNKPFDDGAFHSTGILCAECYVKHIMS